MALKIKGAEASIGSLFSEKYEFHIPSYQRPYAWTTEQAGELFKDLYDFYKDGNKDDNYFLGSIVLEKTNDDEPLCQVIDGQQRLTTLTILISVLASKMSEKNKNDFAGFLEQAERPSLRLAAKPRLILRNEDEQFFQMYIQKINYSELFSKSKNVFSIVAQQNIYENAKFFYEQIDNLLSTEDERLKFGQFIINNCYLIAVTANTQDSAFKVFSVMNNRGLSLQSTDILKAEIIGKINNRQLSEDNTKLWETIENNLGRERFNDLFAQIRTIKAKVKARKGLVEEIKQLYFSKFDENTSISFIENVLKPYSDNYFVIKNSDYKNTDKNKSDEINVFLYWLNSFNHSDWIPPALVFLRQNESNPDLLLKFFKKLERLCAYMYADKYDINNRINRFSKLTAEIETTSKRLPDSIELTNDEKKKFMKTLDCPIYSELTDYKRNYFILRLDSFIAANRIDYQKQKLSIEHVLPQKIDSSTEWAKIWNNEEKRKYWLDRIGNLIPLTQKVNSECQNKDFLEKKEKYYTSKNGTSVYALTTRLLSKKSWTPKDVENNQCELLTIYKKNWELDFS